MAPGEDGPSRIAAIAADETAWSLDTVMRRDPRANPVSDGELIHMVKTLRAERAAIDVKQEKAKAKKQGVEDDAKDNSDEPSNT